MSRYPKKEPLDREYMEMIYSLLTEMNGAIMAQVRSINNNMAKVLTVIIDIQNSINILNQGMVDTRDKRNQQEIELLESQVESMKKQIEEKKQVKVDNQKTSQDIERIAMKAAENAMTIRRESEETEKETVINKRKEAVITAIWVSGTLALVWAVFAALAPLVEQVIQNLAKK